MTDAPKMTMDEALELLGVDSLPGMDGDGARDLLEGMARMVEDQGEDWVRENQGDLVELWSAMLAQAARPDED